MVDTELETNISSANHWHMLCDAFCHFESGFATGFLKRLQSISKACLKTVLEPQRNSWHSYCINIVMKSKQILIDPQICDEAFSTFSNAVFISRCS